MPPAKKTNRRTTTRTSRSGPITRREVEATTKRFEKALDDASTALSSMGSNFGRNAKSTYREIERALKQLRRDAGKANRTVLKDLEQVWSAAGSATSSATARARSKSSRAKKSTTRKSTTSRSKSGSSTKSSSSTRSSTKKASSKRSGTKRSGAKRSSNKRSSATKSSGASKSSRTR